MIKDYVEKKYSDVHVSFSGYAIHLTPVDTSKARALEYLVDKLGYSLGQVVAIADSIVDLELCRIAGYCIAVGNADKELKEEADYITREPSGRGFIEFCKKLLQDTNYL